MSPAPQPGGAGVPEEEGQFVGEAGVRLHFRSWPAPGAQRALVVLHGLGEHSGRYAALGHELAAQGVSVYAMDHRGHGHSAGRRGHVARFELLLRDAERFRQQVSDSLPPGTPLFLLGHSLGGLIALRYLQRFPTAPFRGAILSAPLLGIAVPAPAWKRGLGIVLARVAPALALSNGLDAEELSHDPLVVAAYRGDPLVHDRITPRLYTEMVVEMQRAASQRQRLAGRSLLFIIPGADRIVDPAATRSLAQLLPGDVEIREFDGFRHESLNELGREQVLRAMVAWMSARCA